MKFVINTIKRFIPFYQAYIKSKKQRKRLDFLESRKDAYDPGHYYSSIPDFKNIDPSFFRNQREIKGIELNDSKQFELLKKLIPYYKDLPFTNERQQEYRYFYNNTYYRHTDAILLYCLIRHFIPGKIIEVGSGFSSALMLDINEIYFKNAIELIFIEPFPDRLKSLMRKEERARIIEKPVQEVAVKEFEKLNANDILFIDSSHVAKIGSDVNYYFFEIFPLLQSGVIIHIHDIFKGFEYPEDWVLNKRWAWNEAYMLRCFLLYNSSFEIIFWNDYMAKHPQGLLLEEMPLCKNDHGGSIWLRKQ